jgi:nicotinamidase-related amidase
VPALPLPPFVSAERAGELYRVPYAERAREARAFAAAHGIGPAAEDRTRVGLLLIDVQNTFCLPGFELFVGGRSGRGAVEDNARLTSFLYANLGLVSEIVATLDTHQSTQVFHPLFWLDGRGEHPAPYTVIRSADVDAGRYRVNPALAGAVGLESAEERRAYALHYTRALERGGRFPLTVWPYHALLGGVGHALVSAVEEAAFFHSVARQAATRFEIKGSHPLTEHFSALRPEVVEDQHGRRVGELNRALIERLLGFDALIVAGQAKSHCVAWSVEDLLREIQARDAASARRIYLLEDASSPVVVPGVVDYSEAADRAFARFAAAGMRLVRTSEPVESWAGFPA